MGRIKELISKGSGKYFDWKNKRANEKPFREARRVEKKKQHLLGLKEKTELVRTKNRLISAKNRSISLRKQRLRSGIGFFTGIKPGRVRTVRIRKKRRKSKRVYYRTVQEPQTNNLDTGRFWFE